MKGFVLAIFAAVVAIATFAIHQYCQGDQTAGLSLVTEILRREHGARSEPPSLEAIQKKTEELTQLMACRDEHASANQQASVLLDELDRMRIAIEQDPQGDEAQLSELRISTLHVKYIASQIDRDQFAKPFLEFADRLIAEQPKGRAAEQAAMLRLVAQHDLRRPATREVLQDLDGFAASHPQSLGAMAFCLVAQELVQNKQPESAESVLRHGIDMFRSTAASGTLVKQLVDLGFCKAPESEFPQGAWKALDRMNEHTANRGGPKSKLRRK
jgi:hypothetical protein